jgi:hypothetical protein
MHFLLNKTQAVEQLCRITGRYDLVGTQVNSNGETVPDYSINTMATNWLLFACRALDRSIKVRETKQQRVYALASGESIICPDGLINIDKMWYEKGDGLYPLEYKGEEYLKSLYQQKFDEIDPGIPLFYTHSTGIQQDGFMYLFNDCDIDEEISCYSSENNLNDYLFSWFADGDYVTSYSNIAISANGGVTGKLIQATLRRYIRTITVNLSAIKGNVTVKLLDNRDGVFTVIQTETIADGTIGASTFTVNAMVAGIIIETDSNAGTCTIESVKAFTYNSIYGNVDMQDQYRNILVIVPAPNFDTIIHLSGWFESDVILDTNWWFQRAPEAVLSLAAGMLSQNVHDPSNTIVQQLAKDVSRGFFCGEIATDVIEHGKTMKGW